MVDWVSRDRRVREAFEKNGWVLSRSGYGWEFDAWKAGTSFWKRVFGGRMISVNLRKGEARLTVWDSLYSQDAERIMDSMPYPSRMDISG